MSSTTWKVSGLLFENCSCQLICPAHISFKNYCTRDRCTGHWAIHIDEGQYGETILNGLNGVVVFDAPQRMYEGGWTETLYLDDRADPAQREALEAILTGRAGGPWAVLARFVSTWLETQCVPMHFEDNGRQKHLRIDGLFETSVEAIRARDDVGEAVLVNLFNQIHGAVHVLARGWTRCTDRSFDIALDKTHGLYSRFVWEGTG
jgi:hypothetical protein